MLDPKEIRAGTIDFQIQPSPSGIGYEVKTTKGRSRREFKCGYCETLERVLGVLRHHTLQFYTEELDALNRRIDADADVAGACCPECEDSDTLIEP